MRRRTWHEQLRRVENGTPARVLAVEGDRAVLELDDGRRGTWTRQQLDRADLRLGYVQHPWPGQGLTVERLHYVHDTLANARSTYVAATRPRGEFRLYAARETLEQIRDDRDQHELDVLAESLGQAEQEAPSIDVPLARDPEGRELEPREGELHRDASERRAGRASTRAPWWRGRMCTWPIRWTRSARRWAASAPRGCPTWPAPARLATVEAERLQRARRRAPGRDRAVPRPRGVRAAAAGARPRTRPRRARAGRARRDRAARRARRARVAPPRRARPARAAHRHARARGRERRARARRARRARGGARRRRPPPRSVGRARRPPGRRVGARAARAGRAARARDPRGRRARRRSSRRRTSAGCSASGPSAPAPSASAGSSSRAIWSATASSTASTSTATAPSAAGRAAATRSASSSSSASATCAPSAAFARGAWARARRRCARARPRRLAGRARDRWRPRPASAATADAACAPRCRRRSWRSQAAGARPSTTASSSCSWT